MRSHYVVVITVLSIVHVLSTPSSADDNDPGTAKAATLACQANLAAFQYYKCRFELTRCDATSLDAAVRGELTNRRSCEFLLVVDGTKERYQEFGPSPPKAGPQDVKPPQDGKPGITYRSAEFLPGFHLRLKDRSLRFTPDLEQATFENSPTYLPGVSEYAPLSLGIMGERDRASPFKHLDDGKKGLTQSGLYFPKGGQTVDVRFVYLPGGDGAEHELYFDPARGFLPSRALLVDIRDPKNRKIITYSMLLEARECHRGTWFPTHLRIIHPTAKGASVVKTKVIELEYQKRPTKEDFSVTLPAGTVICRENTDQRFRLRQDETLNPDDLPTIEQMLAKSLENKRMDTAIEPQRSKPWLVWVYIGAGVLCLGAFIGLYRFRRARAA
jgi:hypothetical protein